MSNWENHNGVQVFEHSYRGASARMETAMDVSGKTVLKLTITYDQPTYVRGLVGFLRELGSNLSGQDMEALLARW